ncbi:hypothetical protein PanWU01x14_102600 [Parasponia andersonii]|uniref:Uncharacterized protein n=1 Tax=Parasponia andersonii TaxID=3476 RepID=A0A2P5D2D9_PARAD|nr:hypothetical protein PanWU01x14_102600 [Parasponia andersonii]
MQFESMNISDSGCSSLVKSILFSTKVQYSQSHSILSFFVYVS